MSNNTSIPSVPEFSTVSTVDNDSLKEKELILREKELALKEQEVKAKIELDKRGVWFSSPLLIGLASAIFGLIGTGVGAALQGYSNFQLEKEKIAAGIHLERQKFEFAVIQKATDGKDEFEASKQLFFLTNIGIIQGINAEKMRNMAANPRQIPLSSERQKFEFAVIQKALDSNSNNRDEAAKQLIFLIDSGVIQSLDSGRIRKTANQPQPEPSPSILDTPQNSPPMPNSKPTFPPAPKSWCLGMKDQWRFRKENFGQDDKSIKVSMHEQGCDTYRISVP